MTTAEYALRQTIKTTRFASETTRRGRPPAAWVLVEVEGDGKNATLYSERQITEATGDRNLEQTAAREAEIARNRTGRNIRAVPFNNAYYRAD